MSDDADTNGSERRTAGARLRAILLGTLGLGAFTAIFWLNAWVNEDAYITFRSLE